MTEILIAFIFSLLLILTYLAKLDKIFILSSTVSLIITKYTFGFDRSIADVCLVVLWVIIFYTILKIITNRALRDKSE